MRHYENIDYAGNAHFPLDQLGTSEEDVESIISDERYEIARSGDTVIVLGEVGASPEMRVVYQESRRVGDDGSLNAMILGISSE